MPGYLLGSQTFADVANNYGDSRVHKWVRERDLDIDEVTVSSISFMVLKRTIETLDSSKRADWQILLNEAVIKFESRVIPITARIALRAAELSSRGLLTSVQEKSYPLGDAGLLVLATALDEELTLAERRKPYHAEVERLDGLQFIDPYK